MSISLVTRSGNGAPVTAVQNDANMAAIQAAVNQNAFDIGNRVTTDDFNNAFTAVVLGKAKIDWTNVLNKPAQFTNSGAFRAVKTDSVQTISASGTLTAHFNTKDFDQGTCYDTSTYRYTPPFTGVSFISASVQVSLASGSPTNVSIITSIRINGAARAQATLDNTGTGTRIYKVTTLANMTAGDYADVIVEFNFGGTATWQIDATNTTFEGFGVNLHT